MANVGAWLTSAFIFLLGVAALSRLLEFKGTPGLITDSLSALSNLFSNTVKGKTS